MTVSCLIVCSSRTGNTLKIAEAIHRAVRGSVLCRTEEAPDPSGFDCVFAGFWADKGEIDALTLSFLSQLPEKEVFLFGTMGSSPDSPHGKAFRKKAERFARSRTSSGKTASVFLSQGKINPEVTARMNRLLGKEKAEAPERLAALAEASRHPDEADCRAAADWAEALAGSEE